MDHPLPSQHFTNIHLSHFSLLLFFFFLPFFFLAFFLLLFSIIIIIMILIRNLLLFFLHLIRLIPYPRFIIYTLWLCPPLHLRFVPSIMFRRCICFFLSLAFPVGRVGDGVDQCTAQGYICECSEGTSVTKSLY